MTPFDIVLAGLLKLPIAHEDQADPRKPAQLAALALEVSQLKPPAGLSRKDWWSLVLAVGAAETHFSLRVMDGQCKPFECDRGKARSSWQLHKNLYTASVWDQLHGFAHLSVQVQAADAMLKRSYYQCRAAATDPLVLVQRTVHAFAGLGCLVDRKTVNPWRGLQLRNTYWLRVRQAMG